MRVALRTKVAVAGLLTGLVAALLSQLYVAHGSNEVAGVAPTPSGNGYWVVSPSGVISASGDAVAYGDMSGKHLNKSMVGIAATPTGHGYWLLAGDGGVFSFGDAAFYGSTGSLTLNKPVVGMAATATGHGYWLVASDGGIFAYGDASFYGSTGAIKLNKPVVGMASTPSGHGYWLVASDGGIFSYGDAAFFGSTGGTVLNKPVVGMASTSSGHGYWLVASDGGIFAYGDAAFYGRPDGGTALGIVRTVVGYTVLLQEGAPAAYGPSGQSAPTTTTTLLTGGSYPSSPPALICGSAILNNGPTTAPAGAITVPAGDNSSLVPNYVTPGFGNANKTFWFAPGTHTLGNGQYDQIGPGNNSTFIGAPGAIIDGQGKNDFAFAGHANNVTLKYLTIRNFISPNDQGVVNHDSGVNWTFQYNTMTLNQGGALFLGAGNLASYNCLKDNGQYGFQGYGPNGGESNITLDHNEIVGNNTGNWEVANPGCGCTGGGKFWDVRDVRVIGNYVHDNHSVGLWADTNDADFVFDGNWIENNEGQGIFYEISYNAAIRNNVFKHNLTANGAERIAAHDNFPDAEIYISESGGDSRVPYSLVGSPVIDISNNLFTNNFNGVSLWENADRYCGSPNNTSSGYCTLVNPGVAKLSTCNATNIANAPYYSDCRWKTQNVKVHNNTFNFSMSGFAGCTAAYCGHNAITSNYGTSPAWSPYKGNVVQQAVTFNQGNVFSNNTYTGSWQFMPIDTGHLISPNGWKAAPYNQDAGSTFN